MYYTSFQIKNFKGIKDATIRLSEQSKVGIFSFVGLNESGKTTILEAIHSFSPDPATSEVIGGDQKTGVPFPDRVPRNQISNFSGDVSVKATVHMTEEERRDIISEIKSKYGITVEPDSLPCDVTIERYQRFKSGDFQKSYFSLRCAVRVKTGKQRNWREPNSREKGEIRDSIYNRTPDIAYFPTFVFDFPSKIYLTEGRGDEVSNFYRQAFQDILDYEGSGDSIEDSITRRVRSEDKQVPWVDFLDVWRSGNDKDKIQHVMDRASATVTDVVFGRWNEIFGEDASGKEIIISFDTLEGEVRDKQTGAIKNTEKHDLYVKFKIKDGTRRFDVNDRSLGFRWFFSFMMFTQFRVAREGSRPILFLFDEPASNLHAAAQKKLIDSFPEIARDNHTLAYSTHSHYMIEPKWLEQTFIVTNREDSPSNSVIGSLSFSDESLDIQATRYRKFVSDHPSKTSYFQPVLDRLEVVPSKFDIERQSIIVEGKSDYYVLRYASRLLGKDNLPVMPALGAGTFGALISLHIGWGLRVLVLLDGDRKGKEERDKYVNDYGLGSENAMTLDEIEGSLKVIEDLLDGTARETIKNDLDLSSGPSKNQIRRFFQERLARDEVVSLGDVFEEHAKAVLDELEDRIRKIG